MLDEGERIVPMRLQRFLARAGVASRRGSERLMTSGRVRVNGVVVSELGSKVDPSVDVVTVDGKPCSITERSRYVMLYKPQGYITTMSDPQGRPTVAELVPSREFPGLFPSILDTTVASAPTTNPRFSRNLLVFSFPPTRMTVLDSPAFTIAKGIIHSLLSSLLCTTIIL